MEQNRSQSTGPSTPYPSGPTTPMRGHASVAQYWVKHTRLERVELLGPEACAVRTWWNEAPPDGTSTCTALLESKVGSVISDTNESSLKWERIGSLCVPGTTCRQPKGENKKISRLFPGGRVPYREKLYRGLKNGKKSWQFMFEGTRAETKDFSSLLLNVQRPPRLALAVRGPV